MNWRRVVVPCAVLFGVNCAILLRSAWNRSGAVRTIELTERELVVSHAGDENSATLVRLSWTAGFASWRGDTETWLNRAKLVELGFNGNCGPCSPAATKRVYVALELDGPSLEAWRKYEDARMQKYADPLSAEKEKEFRWKAATRLVAVDAAREAEPLLRKYANATTHVVIPGLVSASFQPCRRKGCNEPELQGGISKLLVDEIHVPRPYSDEIHNVIRRPGDHPIPRFKMRLCFGQAGDPWVCGVRPVS